MSDAELISRIDPIVWKAHLLVPLPCGRDSLRFDVPVSQAQWERYWSITRNQARGYWHGATGLIAERLNIKEDEWLRMCRFHLPEPPTCLGDSSADYSHCVEAAGVPERQLSGE